MTYTIIICRVYVIKTQYQHVFTLLIHEYAIEMTSFIKGTLTSFYNAVECYRYGWNKRHDYNYR
jgi:hypothetical protein